MKLKNSEIVALVNLGLLNTTEHDVPAADAYKAYKFRKAVEKACRAIAEKEDGLRATAGIEPDKKPTKEQEEKLSELRVALYNDEAELEGNIVPMSWEGFHALACENRKVAVQVPSGTVTDGGAQEFTTQFVDVFRACEGILEGVLFKTED